MINDYRRAARSVTELGIGGFAALDLAVPELAAVAKTAPPGPEGGPNDEEELTGSDEKTNHHDHFGLVAQSVELRTFNP
jgi:hypothetical protein